jgi:hypothetical protein
MCHFRIYFFLLTFFTISFSTTLIAQGCENIIYRSPGVDLQIAVDQLAFSVGGGTLRLTTGTYYLSKTLELKDNVTIEGGFMILNGEYVKTSEYGATTLIRTGGYGFYYPSVSWMHHLIAISVTNKTNFKLQDLKITTINFLTKNTSYCLTVRLPKGGVVLSSIHSPKAAGLSKTV